MGTLISSILRKKKVMAAGFGKSGISPFNGNANTLETTTPSIFSDRNQSENAQERKICLHTPVCDPSNMSSQEDTVCQIQAVPHSANPETGRRCGHNTVACHKTSSSVNSENG
jgi:hypothetical protein